MTNTPAASTILVGLCRSQPLAVLATNGPSGPYANLVAVAFTSDLRHLYFATPRRTRKWNNLQNSPKVSLLLDNRSNKESDFSEGLAATLLGTALELQGEARIAPQKIYCERHPRLQDFVTSADTALYEVTIEQILLVGNFQQVTIFDFSGREGGIDG